MTTMNREKRNSRRRDIAYQVLMGLKSLAGAAETNGVSITTAREACSSYGIDPKECRAILYKRIAMAFKNKSPKEKILLDFGVKQLDLKRACFNNGVMFEPLGPNTDQSLDILSDLLTTYDTLTTIAENRSVSVSCVSSLYNRALAKGFPIPIRSPGIEPQPFIDVAISLDDSIDECASFFSLFTRSISSFARLHILASEGLGDWNEIAQELFLRGIAYHLLTITDDKAGYILENGVDICFEDTDERFIDLPEFVKVFKLRTVENFNFESTRWLYSDDTGEKL